MGRNGCPIFSRPLKVESNMVIKKIIVYVYLKRGQPDKTKRLVLKLRPPPHLFMMRMNFTLGAGETYKVFSSNYSLQRSKLGIWSLKWMDLLMGLL